ncbi:MAG: GSCFA domain-containing protein, partial [Bacteroidota bacterium]
FREGLFEQDGQWYSFGLHSDMRHRDRRFLESMIDGGLQALGAGLAQAKVLVLTLGTALVFRHVEQDEIVANCHRAPASAFRQEMLTVAEVEAVILELVDELKEVNPDMQVMLTVSPVRHLRSGIVESSASKSMLRAACHTLTHNHPSVHYFPAYELLLDDLRDYRFFQSDLMHPTEMAETYIWEKFSTTYLSPEARDLNTQLAQALKDLAHRPRDPRSDAHRTFLQRLEAKLQTLNNHVNLSLELQEIRERMRR